MSRRVVVTGMSGVTAFGNDWQSVEPKLRDCQNATQYMPSYEQYDGLNTKLAAPILDFDLPKHYKRKQVRGMGRVSKLATVATENALSQAGLIGNGVLTNGQTGIAYGSSTGSTDAIGAFGVMLNEKTTKAITATTYVQMMPHTTAVNVGLFFGLKGRVIPTSSACTSGSQAIGYAYEAIKHGYQTVMVAGGAEELCPTESAVFDTLFATSLKNEDPKSTPRPYDSDRDGLVIGEGAGTLVLEEYEHAVARGAKIYAEIIGFASNCDAAHVTQPQMETMQICMEMALQNAGIPAEKIDYVSAHGTATDRGDIAESNATANALGKVPISSLKSYFGHTLGACGAIEAWLGLEMMHTGWFNPTLNLENLDEQCGDLDYIAGQGRELDVKYLMSNNFAFGGINTSIIFKKM
ncbi:TPA: beta-ketoacyl-ACP synthase [Vibrio diabolicus]|jgi:3-oxoacyl-[acyl-carrier-protein] synthase II|uniref:beta-ketoacyl-ACP synthase n=1 Tax=Vibrio diabolicus TaxID=50719 RepID=UPI0006B25CFB|nr:beta-ketoacyl-ACP synthase [Vibrio diabolicus]KOY46892.1 3-oxoacyl-ACP synthase [Vibrio parahaemolyticus]MCG6284308.1 beta-ketoacyl-ACP synthase [Vibrio diabolicus]MCS0378730.1 beta-ketoacyl-ACP synthase [Vibrio diabolicus]MCS0388008.1 beta-ketoacyl-ACP synthase [Vibrio diabolicus]MCS0420518.1 beta-ketoacyl-ACP synthase [Vibrio diabolicus]|eukprot:NODE_197_length_2970_cov_2.924131_g183_i0.p1 GENE.NODE_197_length_2970_cov_2.924131_g183_i0~~NODE_197_length_2970_cov_2.924131_g183_i0.p1  ORF type:complete len:408 (+),score=56.30 NODE_197_length_2970_cov_2.924131_g183_i0:1396-2619(+)